MIAPGNRWLTHPSASCPLCKSGLQFVAKQTPKAEPVKYEYRRCTNDEVVKFKEKYRGEGWYYGVLNKHINEEGYQRWAMDSAMIHVLRTATGPIAMDDFLDLARMIPVPKGFACFEPEGNEAPQGETRWTPTPT